MLSIESHDIESISTDVVENVNSMVSPMAAIPLSKRILQPYVDAGLLTPELQPAKGLTKGQISMLAHDIAMRHKIEKYWSFFEEIWHLKGLRNGNSKYAKRQHSVEFMKLLSKIK